MGVKLMRHSVSPPEFRRLAANIIKKFVEEAGIPKFEDGANVFCPLSLLSLYNEEAEDFPKLKMIVGISFEISGRSTIPSYYLSKSGEEVTGLPDGTITLQMTTGQKKKLRMKKKKISNSKNDAEVEEAKVVEEKKEEKKVEKKVEKKAEKKVVSKEEKNEEKKEEKKIVKKEEKTEERKEEKSKGQKKKAKAEKKKVEIQSLQMSEVCPAASPEEVLIAQMMCSHYATLAKEHPDWLVESREVAVSEISTVSSLLAQFKPQNKGSVMAQIGLGALHVRKEEDKVFVSSRKANNAVVNTSL
eukprot:TRINITY_DN157_c0_g5_i1.p1 TRINITY_DN157_c0_g5~~TRINITY_DN157_c0_g5_i1.p1  ORF type:complete len:311 (+),score=136.83 TRINITY_DN157_c0_g5_i1:31-933(+)